VDDDRWGKVDEYLNGLLLGRDESLDDALRASDAAGLPPINVAANQGKFLELLARMHHSKRILEVGTLGGYSTIWLSRALPPDGHLVTLELEPAHAAVAQTNLDRAGVGHLVEIVVGPAAATMRRLISEKAAPFDFIFIDADKEGYPEYFDLALELAQPGSVIVADNVIRDGAVVDVHHADSRVHGVRAFFDHVAASSRVTATAVQTVGSKGYDGFALLIVT